MVWSERRERNDLVVLPSVWFASPSNDRDRPDLDRPEFAWQAAGAKQTKAAAAGEEFAKAAVLPRTGIAEEGGEDARGAFGV